MKILIICFLVLLSFFFVEVKSAEKDYYKILVSKKTKQNKKEKKKSHKEKIGSIKRCNR